MLLLVSTAWCFIGIDRLMVHGDVSFIRTLWEHRLHVRNIVRIVLNTLYFSLLSGGLLLVSCFYCAMFS
jgi:hypothetical protein